MGPPPADALESITVVFERRGAGLLALIVVIGVSAPARADDAKSLATRAVELAKEGRDTGDKGKFDEAIALFKRAFALDPRPEYQCGIGIAYADAGKSSPAHLFIGRCIARTVSPERKQQLRGFHDSLEQSMKQAGFVPVDVVTRPTNADVHVSYFAADETVPSPVQVWLPAGDYELTASAAGHVTATRGFTVGAGESVVRVAVELEVAPPPETAPPVVEKVREPVAVRQEPPRSNTLPHALWAIGGAALAGGAVYHVLAYRNIDSIRDAPSSVERSDTVGVIKQQRTIAVGLYGIGAVVAGVGVYLRFRSLGVERDLEMSLAPVTGGGVVALRWRR